MTAFITSQPLASLYLLDHIDILAHLFFASGNADRVHVTWPLGSLEGSFCYPDGTRVVLAHARHYTPPPIGSVVHIEYDGQIDKYRFYTTVLDHFAGEVVLAFPESVECTDRRLTLRLPLSSDTRVTIHIRGRDGFTACKPVDLSDGGVGFIGYPGCSFESGHIFDAFLDIGEQSHLGLRAEVRHVRSTGEGQLVGSRFVSMGLADRARLARFLLSHAAVEAHIAP